MMNDTPVSRIMSIAREKWVIRTGDLAEEDMPTALTDCLRWKQREMVIVLCRGGLRAVDGGTSTTGIDGRQSPRCSFA